MTEPISPCPFCGEQGIITFTDGKEISDDRVRILCTGCGAATRTFSAGNSWSRSDAELQEAHSKAIKVWNQRKG